MKGEEEFTATAKLTVVPNGVMIEIAHPERGSTPAWTERRVYNDLRELHGAMTELWDDYCQF